MDGRQIPCRRTTAIETHEGGVTVTCTELEERVARAELGRDNACAQHDEAQARSKRARESAGRRIGELLVLVDRLVQEVPDDSRQSIRAWTNTRLAEILGHAKGSGT